MDTLEDRGMDRRLADRGGHGADPREAKAVTQRIKLNHCSSHRKQGSPRLELTSRLSWATLPGSSFQGLTEARCAPAPGAPPTRPFLPPLGICLPPAVRSGYLCFQLSTCGAGSLLDLNVHLGEELLALANLLTERVVVLNHAQDMAATLAGPQVAARDQARHARDAGG